MAEKVQGKVKWFSNRKGFGFVAPDNGGDDIFLHHSRIVSDADYKTLKDGFMIQFEIGTDDEGKPFADKITSADGTPIPPPGPRNKKKAVATGNSDEAKEASGTEKATAGGKKKKPKKEEWFTKLDDSVTKSMESRGIKIQSGRVFVSVGDARLKVGTGGYVTLAHASGVIAEGSYTYETDGKITIAWEKVLKLDGDEWKASTADAESGLLVKVVDLTDDAVKPTGEDEKTETLWGEGKPDPKDVLEKEGFLMRKVALTAAANPGRRGRGPRNRKRNGKGGGEAKNASSAPAPSTET